MFKSAVFSLYFKRGNIQFDCCVTKYFPSCTTGLGVISVIQFTSCLTSKNPHTWVNSKRNHTWFGNCTASFSLLPGLKEDLPSVIKDNDYLWCVASYQAKRWLIGWFTFVCILAVQWSSCQIHSTLSHLIETLCSHLIRSALPFRLCFKELYSTRT